jgi:hypothetical protein
MPLLPNTRVKPGGVEQVGICDGPDPPRFTRIPLGGLVTIK